MDRYGGRISIRPFDIDIREIRKLFVLAVHDRIDGNTASGQAILIKLADGAEIRSAKESDPVVLAPIESAVARLLDAEPGKARAPRQLPGGRIFGHVEIIRIVDDL